MNDKYLKTFIVVLLLSTFSASFAQSIESIEGQMDEIKLSEKMIYGEDFNDDKNIAYQNALSELLTYANEFRMKKGKSMIKVSDLQPIAKELTYSKVNRHNVLVYIQILQLLSIKSKNNSDIITKTTDNESLYNNIDPSQTSEVQTTTEQNNFNSKDGSNSVKLSTISPKESDAAPQSNEIIDILCSQDNWSEIKGFITTFKSQGKIKETGFCTSHTEVPTDAYSILIDDMYGILSILSPKNTANRINYKTNLHDSETNYPNCKVIVWYR